MLRRPRKELYGKTPPLPILLDSLDIALLLGRPFRAFGETFQINWILDLVHIIPKVLLSEAWHSEHAGKHSPTQSHLHDMIKHLVLGLYLSSLLHTPS